MGERHAGKARRVGPHCEYTADEEAFIRAVDAYKSRTGVRFPTLCELLAVLRSLGYSKSPPPPPPPCGGGQEDR